MILVMVFFAMAIPVACIVLGAQSYFQKPAPALDSAAFAPLQKSLEGIADKSFEEKTSLPPDQLVSLLVAEPELARQKVEARVLALGGVAFQSESPSDDGAIYLLAQIPENRLKAFLSAPMEAKPDEAAPSVTEADEARALVNVVLKKQAQ